jgi:lipopolysaccharide export system protein LptC
MRLTFKTLTIIFIVLVIGLGWMGGWWDIIRDELWLHSVDSTKPLRPDPPSIVITRPRLIGWQDYKKSWEIEALRIWQSAEGNRIHFQKIINGVVFSVKDKRVDFSAEWARLEKASSDLYLGGGLEAKIDQGGFTTSEGVMNYKREELLCPKEVIYTENDTLIKAQKMIIKFSKDEILMEGDVELIEKKDQMKANGLLYNTKEKKYYLIDPKGITLYP